MEKSLYFSYIEKYFPKLVMGISEKINGTHEQPTYTHLGMLNKDYSVDGRWASIIGNHRRISADVVAMDSSLPLKKRGSLARAEGDIPKMGLELYLNEKQMSDIRAMIAMNMPEESILAKIFDDTGTVITAVEETIEELFLRGLSTGVALTSEENVGTGVRLNFGYFDENQFATEVLWSTPADSLPINDFKRVAKRADELGYSINIAYADDKAIEGMLNSLQIKQMFAFAQGFAGENIQRPSLAQANMLINEELGFTIKRMDRTVIKQVDGQPIPVKPWKEGTIVFTVDQKVGSLVWTHLAEHSHPVEGVTYQSANDYTLVSKFRVNRPSLREYTTAQARVVPIITNVDRIYTLDTLNVEA